ncbi:AAA family ATPase [Paenibacillus lupini]|uniref:AAA family ATPase n=1 Tax=Paenibacillus lupini TaxID=1450204 RepID=UPI0014222467|nr:AAA family ATPase [Paenibacillus lupini]NIK24979.1 DNA repair exonuclease SbcCD ATPase subunit [Paenibacillus lupini]
MSNKFSNIELEHFRGYRNKQTFDFTVSNGVANLIVIYAPNGFGKTSFFDAVEWGFSGSISRLSRNRHVKSVADEEKGYIIKNRESGEQATVKFSFDNNSTDIIINSKKIDGKRKRDDVNGDIVSGEELFHSLNGELFIKNNVLTHDQVDSFLRFTDSKEKYNALKTFWDDKNDTEVYKNILVVKKVLEKKKENFGNELIKIKADIKSSEPSEKIITYITGLFNQLGEDKLTSINFFNTESSFQLDEIIIDLNKKKSNNEHFIQDHNKTMHFLEELKLNYEIVYLKFNEEMQTISQAQNINKENIQKFIHLSKLLAEESNLEQNVKLLRVKQADYGYIFTNIDNYEVIKTNLNSLENKESQLNESLIKLNQDLQFLNTQNKEMNNSLSIIKNKFDLCTNKIEKLQGVVGKLNSVGADYNLKKRVERIHHLLELIEKRELKLNSTKIRINEFVNNALNDPVFFPIGNELLFIKENYEELIQFKKSLRDKKEQLIQKKQELLNSEKMSTKLEELLILGTQVVIDYKKSSCPLCNHTYSDMNELLNRINNDKDIFNLEGLSKEILILDTDLTDLDNLIIKENNEILRKIEKHIEGLNAELHKLKTHHLYFQNQKLLTETKLKNVFDDIEHIKKYFYVNNLQFNCNKEELFEHLISYNNLMIIELNSHQDNIDALMVKRDAMNKNNTEINNEINHTRELIDLNKKLVKDIRNSEVFSKVNEQIIQNNIDPINLRLNMNNIIALVDQKIMTKLTEIEDIKAEKSELEISLEAFSETELKSEFIKLENQLNIKLTAVEQFKKNCLNYFGDQVITLEDIERELKNVNIKIESIINKNVLISEILSNFEVINNNRTWRKKRAELDKINKNIEINEKILSDIISIREKSRNLIEQKIKKRLNLDTINKVYQMIDPHPLMKHISIELEDSEEDQLGLNIYTLDNKKDDRNAPILYFSSAQVNMLSLSIFLAGALEDQGEINTIFMDDPIQHLDGINLLSFIDLLRIISTSMDRQVIISTHDERFFKLVNRKIDPKYFKSKFIELETFGKVK